MALAQSSTVTGVVISGEDDQPVIGASVLVKGTTLGTITDIDGKFTIADVPSSSKLLQVSFVGMETQEVQIKPGTPIKVVLRSSSEMLDEVMVVAYGTAKKVSFTGSASTVTSKSIEKLQVSNVSKALEGAAPGVQVAMQSGQPGSSATVRIRGIGSINSSASPLYVVDGMPYDGSISAINPADIESINVLKDAASTSLYGEPGYNPYSCDNGAIVDANGQLTSAKLLYHDDREKESIHNGLRQVCIQKRIDTWMEGNRYLDAKRRGETIDRSTSTNHAADLPSFNAVTYSSRDYRMIYHIPNAELENNPSITADDDNE